MSFIESSLKVRRSIAKMTDTNSDDWFLCLKARFGLEIVYSAIKEVLGPGSVLTTPYTCITAINPIMAGGLEPQYIDIDPALLSTSDIPANRITADTRAIVMQHTLGIIDNKNNLYNIAKRHNLVLIEDSAHCLLRMARGTDDLPLADISAHSFGVETVGMKDIKDYRPKGHSLSLGQVLLRNYSFEEALVIIKEMTDQLCLQMADRHVMTDTITFFVSYSHDFRDEDGLPAFYTGGTVHARSHTSSDEVWRPLVAEAYRKTTRQDAPVRRIGLSCPIRPEENIHYQFSLFDENGDLSSDLERDLKRQDAGRKLQGSVLSLKNRYGKNAVLKGMNLLSAGTMMERNCQIGGHRSGTEDRCLSEKLARDGRIPDAGQNGA